MDEETVGTVLKIMTSVLICVSIYSLYKLLKGD